MKTCFWPITDTECVMGTNVTSKYPESEEGSENVHLKPIPV